MRLVLSVGGEVANLTESPVAKRARASTAETGARRSQASRGHPPAQPKAWRFDTERNLRLAAPGSAPPRGPSRRLRADGCELNASYFRRSARNTPSVADVSVAIQSVPPSPEKRARVAPAFFGVTRGPVVAPFFTAPPDTE